MLIEKSSMLLVAVLVRKKNDRPNVIKSLLTYQDSSENHSDLLQHVAAQYIISQPLFAVEFTQLTEFET